MEGWGLIPGMEDNQDGPGDRRRFDRRGRGYGEFQVDQVRIWELARELFRAMSCELREDAGVYNEAAAVVWALKWVLVAVKAVRVREDLPEAVFLLGEEAPKRPIWVV